MVKMSILEEPSVQMTCKDPSISQPRNREYIKNHPSSKDVMNSQGRSTGDKSNLPLQMNKRNDIPNPNPNPNPMLSHAN